MLLKNLDEFDSKAVVGDWAFLKHDSHIAIMLHEGMGGVAVLAIKPRSDQAYWYWDGDREAPTLSPSILHYGKGRKEPPTWHGYLRAGQLETV